MTDSTEETSSHRAGTSQDTQKVKLKRLRGSCDECRRKKIACDSAKLPGNVCTHCKRFKLECTHYLYSRPKRSQAQKGYILKLELRIEALENYIKKMYPGEDLDRLINVSLVQDPPSTSSYVKNWSQSQSIVSSDTVSSTAPAEDAKSELSEGEDLAHVALSEQLSHLSLHSVEDRYFGQAGAFMLASQVSALRREITGSTKPYEDDTMYRRLLYWDLKPWELAYSITIETYYEYPELDLLMNLVLLFFEKTDYFMPILHRPTFMKSLSVGQHHWDATFGATVLMVCAIGSKYSDDPRVLLPDDISQLSAGWKYYSQIPLHRKGMLCRSHTYDLQYYALACLFLVGTSMSHAAFNMLAIGLRYACEMGIHRRRGPDQQHTVESESQKRAFWALFCLDRIGYATTGRPCSFSEEYCDVEYPIECDDEYWEPDNPQKAFQQPPGKPSTITAHIHFIKLCEILGVALRTLYVNKKSRLISGHIGSEWERTMVAELDSTMNKWKDSLPEHLSWDPNGRDSIFFKQAANLQTMFSYVQIQIHRPFLIKKSSLSFASLAMCTNAARSCTHVLETAMSRGGLPVLPNTLLAAFAAGSVIALRMWGTFRSGFKVDSSSELETFQRCIKVLSVWEKRWTSAGRICDILNEAISIKQYQAMATETSMHKQFTAQTPTTKISPNAGPAAARTPPPFSFSFNEPLPPQDPSNQELDRLLLTEMGYLLRGDSANVVGTSSLAGSVHSGPVQYTSLNDTFAPELSQFGLDAESYTPWSDISAAFNSFEEWEAYFTTITQSHEF